jgi:hypothetical protein
MKANSLKTVIAAGLLICCLGEIQANSEQRSVLYLGDSLSMGAFGKALDTSLRASDDVVVYTHVAGGASPYYWLRRYEPISCSIGYWEKTPAKEKRVGYVRAVPKVEDLIESYEPDVVVIQTGVNLYATLRSKRRTEEQNVALVEELISDMCYAVDQAGAESYWIAPPESHPKRYPAELQENLATIMKRVVGGYGGSVFESSKVTEWVTPYPSESDGIHYGPIEAKDWAQKVATDFTSYLGDLKARPAPVPAEPATPLRATPIALARPQQPADSVGTAVLPQPEPESEPTPLVKSTPPAPTPLAKSTPPAPAPEPKADPAAAEKTVGAPRREPGKTSEEVSVQIVLRAKSTIENLSEVSYDNAFSLYEYEVVKIEDGEYPYDKIRVAHMVVLHKKFTGARNFEVGKTYHLTLVKQSKYPRLERVQLDDDLPMDLDLPIYICKF